MTTESQFAPSQYPVRYNTIRLNELDIFYREAGPQMPQRSCSCMDFPLRPTCSAILSRASPNSFHVVAPDYPGFGQSSMPDHKDFAYTFENLTKVVEQLVERLGLMSYSLYVMDYGAPIGYRLALMHPERVQALIVQNGNAYDEGLRKFWDPIKKYWSDPTLENREALRFLVDPKSTRWQYENGVADRTLLDPTAWLVDQVGLDRPGNPEIQMDLIHSYETNVPLYPEFQAFFRKYQPPTLIVWGKNDFIFPPEGAAPYLRDLPECGDPHAGHRPFCARNTWGRNRRPNRGIPQAGQTGVLIPCRKEP